MKKLKDSGTTEDMMDEMMQFKEFNELIGFNEFTEIAKKYTE